MQTLRKKQKKFERYNPYVKEIPKLKRPKDNLSRPKTYEEQIYCWFFWLDQIADPSKTRLVLDNLDNLPEFSANWGANWERGECMELKRQRLIMEEN